MEANERAEYLGQMLQRMRPWRRKSHRTRRVQLASTSRCRETGTCTGVGGRSSTVKSGCQNLLPHPIFDEDTMCHKKNLVTVISTSAQGDDLRTVLTVITDANFKNRACNATRLVMVVRIQSARMNRLPNGEICLCTDVHFALQLTSLVVSPSAAAPPSHAARMATSSYWLAS
jgi:hypothetical protein